MNGMINISSMAVRVAIVALLVLAGGSAAIAGPSFSYRMPDGWGPVAMKDAVAAAMSPDGTVQVIIYQFARNNSMSALQLAQRQLKRITYVRVLNPPTDMSQMKAGFGAESVAKMQLVRQRADGVELSYRAFIFVKGAVFVVIEAMATREASEEVFNQANAVINNFKFK